MEGINGMPGKQNSNDARSVESIVALMLDSEQLDQETLAWLEQKLREDDNALRQYLQLVDLDSRLRWAWRGGQYSLTESVSITSDPTGSPPKDGSSHSEIADVATTLTKDVLPAEEVSLAVPLSGRTSPTARRHSRGVAIGIALSLSAMLLLSISISSWLNSDSVGTLTRSFEAEWVGTEGPLALGEAITPGKMALSAGAVEFTLRDKTRLLIEGPASFEVFSGREIFLNTGALAAFVGPDVTGFTVLTPDARVVDLSTAFQVRVVDGGTEVHVIEGEVLASGRTRKEDAEPSEEHRLIAQNAVLFDRDDKSAIAVKYAGEQLKLLGAASLRTVPVAVTGDIRCLPRSPETVLVGEFEHDQIMMFMERSDVELSKTLYADLNAKGEEARTHGNLRMKIPKGMRVNSYLLHFDPKSKNDDDPRYRASGSVKFRSPIVGVFTTTRGLYASDGELRNPQTLYSTSEKIGPRGSEDEVITFSPDGKTINVEFSAWKYADQIRVVTMEEPASN